MMRSFIRLALGSVCIGASLAAVALDTNIPPSGLPSASDYAVTLLPELSGVVSWRTLAQVEPVKEDGKLVPRFSKDILGLDRQQVRVQGFVIPLDMGDKQKRFLLSAVPPHCPFCMPAGPDALVEVEAKTPVSYGFEAIVVSGKFAVLRNDPGGVLYRMTEAEAVPRPAR